MKANPMEVGKLISFYRRQADMTIDELAEKSGVPKGTLNKIIGGVTKAPTLDTMKALAKALGKRLADFGDEPDYANLISLSEKTHIQKYRLLDSHGREMVDLVLDKETERMELEANAREDAQEAGGDVVYVTQYYCRPMSAGTGQEAGDDAPESLHLKKRTASWYLLCGTNQRRFYGAHLSRWGPSLYSLSGRDLPRSNRRLFHGRSAVDQGTGRWHFDFSQFCLSSPAHD